MILGAVLAVAVFALLNRRRRRTKQRAQRAQRKPSKGVLSAGGGDAYARSTPILDGQDDPRYGLLTRRSDYSANSGSPDVDFGYAGVTSPPDRSFSSVPFNRGINRSVASLGTVYQVEPLEPVDITAAGSRPGSLWSPTRVGSMSADNYPSNVPRQPTRRPSSEFGFVPTSPIHDGGSMSPSRRAMNRSMASFNSFYQSEHSHPLDTMVSNSQQPRSPVHAGFPERDEMLSPGRPAASHVYVVHHDRGPAPISIYTDDGAEVVELRESSNLLNRKIIAQQISIPVLFIAPVYSRPPPIRTQPPTESDHGNEPVTSPIRDSPSPQREIGTTPTGLIPPRGVPWISGPSTPPEKGGHGASP